MTSVEVCLGVVVYTYLALFALGLASSLNYEHEKLCAIGWPLFFILLSALLAIRVGGWLGNRLSPAPLPEDLAPTTEYLQSEHYDQAILRPIDDRDDPYASS